MAPTNSNQPVIQSAQKPVTAAALQLTMRDLRRFLSQDNPEFVPPEGDMKQKELNLFMATVVLLRTFDTQRRRVRQGLWDAMEDVRSNVGKFGEGDGSATNDELGRVCLALCVELTKESEKLCPVPMGVIKLLLLGMADLGLVRPPKPELNDAQKKQIIKQMVESKLVEPDKAGDETVYKLFDDQFRHEILNARAVLYSAGSQLGRALSAEAEKKAEPVPENNDLKPEGLDSSISSPK